MAIFIEAKLQFKSLLEAKRVLIVIILRSTCIDQVARLLCLVRCAVVIELHEVAYVVFEGPALLVSSCQLHALVKTSIGQQQRTHCAFGVHTTALLEQRGYGLDPFFFIGEEVPEGEHADDSFLGHQALKPHF